MTSASTLVASGKPLGSHHYPAVRSHAHNQQLVLLHGWGCDSRSWQPLLAHLQQLGDVTAIDLPGFGASHNLTSWTLDNVLDVLEPMIPPQATLIGWSLGGMLAVAMAARHPAKVKRVITLAANVKFVASADYPAAMPRVTNQQFFDNFVADSQRTLKLFSGLLAQGDVQERALLKNLRAALTPSPAADDWQDALTLLSRLDVRDSFASLAQPGLHIFGEADALVPVAAATVVKKINPRQKVVTLPASSHAVHWSQPEKVAGLIQEFIQPPARDKRTIARSFSRAARSYDSVAGLQRSVGEHLLQKIPPLKTPQRVLDLGCGTGYFCNRLTQIFPATTSFFGLDLADAMVRFARERHPAANGSIHWFCGDAEQLPVQSATFDLIFSSLVIQWCDDLPHLFAELYRSLKPGGHLLFSTLGPDTLHELKTAWQAVDNYVHVNPFHAPEEVEHALAQAGFHLEQWQIEKRVLNFPRLVDLTRELKTLGAHNMNRGRAEGLTSRTKIETLKNAYEVFRGAEGLPATYDVIYGVVRR